MITKTCGMRDPQNIRDIEALGVDWMGFIFYPPSPRYVAEKPSYLPNKTKRVGVFVDADMEFISQRVEDFQLDLIQLHGQESADFCNDLRRAFPKVGLIKALSIKNASSLNATETYEGIIDYFLFDTFCKEKGGSGRTFDHSLLREYHGCTPFLLSGGISLDNIDIISHVKHPKLIGYDLNSCFETAPAVKDPQKILQFIQKIR